MIITYRDILKYPGYRVGSDGTVQSCRPINGRGALKNSWRILSPVIVRRHHVVTLGGKLHYVHKLILESFVGLRPEGMECRHLNGNPFDNSLYNLVWGTHKENIEDRRRHGGNQEGEKHWKSKLTDKEVRQIRKQYALGNVSGKELSLKYGVNKPTIHKIINKQLWTHI